MKADSVRSLKAELTKPKGPDTWFLNALGRDTTTRTLSRRFAAMSQSPPEVEVALGITKGVRRGDYQLAARIQASTNAEAERIARAVATKSNGEVDIKIVRDVQGPRPIPPEAFAAAPRYFQGWHRPLEPGLSCGHHQITAGTLGAIAKDANGVYILSNNHVLADVNKGSIGDVVVQPGPVDQPPETKTLVGVLSRFVPISFAQINLVDCALARIDPDDDYWVGYNAALGDPDEDGLINPVQGPRPIEIGDLGRTVVKSGRTTGVTKGRITAVEVDGLRVDMGGPVATFNDQIEVRGVGGPFSAGGDSGSLILDETGYAVALLFAGGSDASGQDVTYGCRITEVLRLLGVELLV